MADIPHYRTSNHTYLTCCSVNIEFPLMLYVLGSGGLASGEPLGPARANPRRRRARLGGLALGASPLRASGRAIGPKLLHVTGQFP